MIDVCQLSSKLNLWTITPLLINAVVMYTLVKKKLCYGVFAWLKGSYKTDPSQFNYIFNFAKNYV